MKHERHHHFLDRARWILVFLVISSWFTAIAAIAAPLDDVTVISLPGPASCYAGTAGPDNVMFLRTKVDQFDCDFSGGGQICLNRREFQEDGANGRPVSLGSPIIQRPSVTGAGDWVVFIELGFNACLMLTGSQFDEGCFGRDDFGIDPHSFSTNPAGTQVAMTRIDLGVSPNLPMNEIYILNGATLVLEESYLVTPGGNQFLQIETVDFTVDGEYLIIDAYDPIAGLWSIYAVDRSNGAVISIVPPVAGLALRNPALAQTSDDHIVFDAQDTSTGVNTVFTANLLSGDLVKVATTGLLSYPSYTGDDRAVVFSVSDNTVPTAASIDMQFLATDRMTPLGNVTRWLTNGGVPEVYRRGIWDGTLKDPADCVRAASADLSVVLIDALEGTYLTGGDVTIYTQIKNISGAASGAFSVNYYASTDASIDAGDALLGTLPAASLGPSEELAGNVKYALPSELGDGNYYIGAILDVSDSNAANNINHDPHTIRVSSSADIQLRPIELDFAEQATAGLSSTSAPDDLFASYQLSHRFQASLVEKTENNQKVRVIVGFESAFQPEGIMSGGQRLTQRQRIQQRGDQLIDSLQGFNFKENTRYQYIPFMALSVDESALEQLFNSPLVTSVVEDRLSAPTMSTSNQVVGSPLAWAESYDGTGQTIAILDTGVDSTHPWFTNGGQKVVSEACYSTNDAQEGAVSVCPGAVESSTAPGSGVNCPDICNHGTHVAGTAAGNDGAGPGFGVARGADLIAIQVFTRIESQEACGGEAQCVLTFTTDQISALERVYELRDSYDIAAVNMSLGGGKYSDQASCDADNGPIKAAIDNLRSVSIVTVVASGNDGFTDSISAPGCISTVISVGNTRRNDEVSFTSNIYPEIHLLAPGTDIDSSIPGTGTGLLTGTSMSAPHVAGAWAVMKQVFPNDSISDILLKLQNTATMVNDSRIGGVETNMPRINLDLAIGEPRTTFGIFNKGPAALNVTSITPETPAPWISWSPQAPFTIAANEMQVVKVTIEYDLAPAGLSQRRLLINSNDPDESPGILINVSAQAGPQPEFDSIPTAGETVTFGNVKVLAKSPEKPITIKNLGTASLTVDCSLIGPNPGDFKFTGCPINSLAGGGEVQIKNTCEPTATGFRTATLRLNTNDADEAIVDFGLTCSGILGGKIFSDGFE